MSDDTRVDPVEEQDPLEGTPYRIVRKLGGGAVGEVYEAEHVGLAKRVVVKILRDRFRDRPDIVDRMRIEAQALARVEHDNLVAVSDFGLSAAGRTFLVLEHLEGRDLQAELDARGALEPREAVDIVSQALSGLAVAHAAGLVHRDIKPANLFLAAGAGGRRVVKVLDFGIAKWLDAPARRGVAPPLQPTGELVVLGTPRYMAPEQIENLGVDARTDLYAMGLVLYRALAGRGPFDHLTEVSDIILAKVAERLPPPSAVAGRWIPPALEAVVMRAIERSPAARYVSAAEMRDALDRAWAPLPALPRPAPAPALARPDPVPLPLPAPAVAAAVRTARAIAVAVAGFNLLWDGLEVYAGVGAWLDPAQLYPGLPRTRAAEELMASQFGWTLLQRGASVAVSVWLLTQVFSAAPPPALAARLRTVAGALAAVGGIILVVDVVFVRPINVRLGELVGYASDTLGGLLWSGVWFVLGAVALGVRCAEAYAVLWSAKRLGRVARG